MGRSFFLGTDPELLAGSRNFARLISAAWADYGLTQAQAEAYVAVDSAWQAAYQAAVTPTTRTQPHVIAKNEARARMKRLASDLAQIISGNNASVSDEQKLALGLSVRDKRSPIPPPGKPGRFKITLDGNGGLLLTWTCDNPKGSRGTIYQIWRRTDSGEKVFLGVTPVKRFLDSTMPAGTTNLVYYVQAVRSKTTGPMAEFHVEFGVTGGEPVSFRPAA